MRVDQNIVDAVKNYFRYGWGPGSCTTLLLEGKYEEARQHAHMNIRGDDIWQNHIDFIEKCIPLCCRGTYVSTWRGWMTESREDSSFDSFMTLMVADDHYLKDWAYRSSSKHRSFD